MIQKSIVFIAILLFFATCNSKHQTGNLRVEGTVKGLRLGTLQLKHLVNDSLVNLDSIKVDGEEHFTFQTHIDEPQVLVLELPQVKDGRISFFAAPNDTIHIFTYVESFGISPNIKGGANQTAKNEFDKMIKQFNNKEMDLFKARFEASKQHLLQEADSLGKSLNSLQRKKKLYMLNFIFRHKDKAIAPYIALMEFYNNPKILDTVYKSLPEDISKNYYAKQINKILTKTDNKQK